MLSRLCTSTSLRLIPKFPTSVRVLAPLRAHSNLTTRTQKPLWHNTLKVNFNQRLRKFILNSLFLQAFQRESGTVTLRLASDSSKKSQKAVGYWLVACSGMVFVAVVLGTAFYFGLLKSVYAIVEEIVKNTRNS